MLNLIMLICFLWILPLITGMMWWQEKKKTGLVLGVRIPGEHILDPELSAIQRQYKKQLLLITIVLLPIPFVGFLIPYDSVCLSIDMLWLLLVFLVPFCFYAHGYRKVKEIKYKKGYGVSNYRKTLVDMKAAAVPRKVSHLSFACASVLSFLPFVLSFLLKLENDSKIAMIAVTGILAVSTLFFWAGSGMLLRTKAEILCGNSTVNENFARMKCRTWDHCMQYCAWVNTAFVILMYGTFLYEIRIPFFGGTGMVVVTGCIVYCMLLLFFVLRAAGKISRIRAKVIQREKQGMPDNLEDDEDNWIFGAIYYNPDDTHVMVEKRLGYGTTVNLATALGKGFVILTVLSLLIIPATCMWMFYEEFTPVNLSLQSDQVVASHLKKEYQVDLSDVTEVRLLEELPRHEKVIGTNMSVLEKGVFDVHGIGTCEFCLNPKKGPFLLLKTEKKTYLFSDAEEGDTRKMYEAIKGK